MVLEEHGGPEVLHFSDVEISEPGAGHVRIAIRAVAMNHMDLWVRRGGPAFHIEYPHRLGCDISGVVESLGEGVDDVSGLSFVDSFYYLDFTLFYGVYSQRMYKLVEDGRTILYFEKLTTQMAGASWPAYDKRIIETVEGVRRRALFNGITPVSQIFGMFVVEPGQVRKTRVTFTTRIHFGEGTGAVARMGSEMPMVIRAGLQSGFESCVAIAKKIQG